MNRLKNDEQGVALLLTIMIVAILTVIVVEGFSTAFVDLTIAGNYRDGIKAEYLTRAGMSFGKAILKADKKDPNRKFDALTEEWARTDFPVPVGDGYVQLLIEDEGGKINLNNLVRRPLGTGNKDEADEDWVDLTKRLFTNLDLDPTVVDCIVDWIDDNDLPEQNGEEQGFYLNLTPSYAPPNEKMKTLRELLLVKGIGKEVFRKIEPYVTMHSDVFKRTSTSPVGRININTASEEVLMALSQNVTAEIAADIVRERADKPFLDIINDPKRVTGVDSVLLGDFLDRITVESDYFTIQARGIMNDVERIEKAFVKRESDGTVTIKQWWSL